MLIITLKFQGSQKKYDYLLDSHSNYNLNLGEDIKIIRGVANDKACYSIAHICGISNVTALPSHVYTKIVVGANNQVTTAKVVANDKVCPVVPAQKYTATKTTPITGGGHLRQERLFDERNVLRRKIDQAINKKNDLQNKLLNYNLEKLFRDRHLPCTSFSGISTDQEAENIQQQIDQMVSELKSLQEQREKTNQKIRELGG